MNCLATCARVSGEDGQDDERGGEKRDKSCTAVELMNKTVANALVASLSYCCIRKVLTYSMIYNTATVGASC